jgi:bifunctional non-homologous end joining protein LigD
MKALATYKKKRRFNETPEPEGSGKAHKNHKLQYVIQRHDASHLHYDFRLEVNGVLKSWAVPKGPSLNPADKRLAVQVEDHPLAYGKFEGEIPEGNYGAGTVAIWDKGTYEPEEADGKDIEEAIDRDIEKGSLKFMLHGGKLNGSFALVRMKNGKGNNWLLIKHDDEYAIRKPYDPDAAQATTRTKSRRKEKRAIKAAAAPPSVRSGKNEKLKQTITPMMAQLDDKPFDNDNWIFEIKWDGYRAVAEVGDTPVRLYSRNGLSFEALYPRIFEALQKIKKEAVLDGEIVVMDKDDRPSFQKLQQYGENPTLPLLYYVFDCLSYQGKDITDLPLLERKKIAKSLVPKNSVIRYSDHIVGEGKEFFTHVVKLNVEGMIAKRADSTYHPGKRTRDWLKIKNHNTQEAIIAGYTAPRGGRQHFGALLLGIREGNKLKYIGHTGTGFTDLQLKEMYLKLKALERDSSPFEGKIPVNSPVTWVEPTLVCEVKFAELTDEGILRQAVFMGLRIDKSAREANHIDVAVKPEKKRALKKVVDKKPAARQKKAAKQPATKEETVKDIALKIDGHKVEFTNLNKFYWPEEGITKGNLVDYYNSMYKFILPYLKDRPESLRRNPNGIIDHGFYHKDAGDAAPGFVKTKTIYSEAANKDIEYIICNDRATLLYLNNLGCIELNPWNSTIKHLDYPDYLVMDIDPSEKNTFEEVVDTALVIKEILDKAGAKSYCKTSGATGLHIYVPMHAQYTYEQVRAFAEIIATLARQALPDTTTMERSLNKRKGRIYLDYLQNKRGQTLAAAYSVRPVPGASVSTPLLWKEVKHGLSPLDFTIFNVQKRLVKNGDLFQNVLKEKTNLKKCLAVLESM